MATKTVKTDIQKLAKKQPNLIHSADQKVVSHTQRDLDEWILHTVMLEGVDVPFKFKRKDRYQSLQGARVNLSYYPDVEQVAGMPFEVMNVVRIKRA